jgi:fatty aldehyde-generating acyl-ACP reductase
MEDSRPMKFATIGHFLDENLLKQFPESWVHGNVLVSPELDVHGTKGYISGLLLTARQMMELPRDVVRKHILNAALLLQDDFNVDLIQLGALTTSVTDGGVWVANQKEYKGYVNHGDSYTAAVTCQTVRKVVEFFDEEPSDQVIAIVGAYGVIGEAVSKLLVSQFQHAILIGRRKEKLDELEKKVVGDFETTVELKTKEADVIVTATSHPDALLHSEHLGKDAIVVDVSQPPNLSFEECRLRPDVCRVDGGLVDFPFVTGIPGMAVGKNFACIVEVIMQAMENERKNHVGSIDLSHLRKTENWGKKYGFTLNELTNFGRTLQRVH